MRSGFCEPLSHVVKTTFSFLSQVGENGLPEDDYTYVFSYIICVFQQCGAISSFNLVSGQCHELRIGLVFPMGILL